jgi:hypothetical protein
MNTTILALDLGTTPAGRCSTCDGTSPAAPSTSSRSALKAAACASCASSAGSPNLQGQHHIDAVFFEEVRRHAGVDAAHAYGGFMGHLTAWCEHHQIPYQGVPVGTIKKHATGKGNAGKDEMIAAVRARGHTPVDDNEADALALLHWASIETQEV